MGGDTNEGQNEVRSRRFNQQQYDLLKKCSDKEDFTEWNQYRKENPDADVELEGAELNWCYLAGAFLDSTKKVTFFKERFSGSGRSYLKGATLWFAILSGAQLYEADLEGAQLNVTTLTGANVEGANLKGASLCASDIRGASFRGSAVDGETRVFNCEVDRKTDFRSVAINGIRMDSGMRELLKYNVRRLNWEDWYGEAKGWQWPIRNVLVRVFWQISDYGKSTSRIISWFFGLAVTFALVYRIWPGLVMVKGGTDNVRGFMHALYFSVVTMTTLGFGDIAASPDSPAGQMLLMVQVILGYVLLGALITRLAMLFMGEGPAGKFRVYKSGKRANAGQRYREA